MGILLPLCAESLKALHHRYQNRELRARESTFIEVNRYATNRCIFGIKLNKNTYYKCTGKDF